MTVVDVLRSALALADRIDGSVDAVKGAAVGPYPTSRMKPSRGFGEASAALADRTSKKNTNMEEST